MKFILITIVLFIIGCSTATKDMPGEVASLVDGDTVENLKITALNARPLNLNNYRVVDVYFRNLNQHWLRIKDIEVVEVMGSPNFNVILGKDLKTWKKSMNLDMDLKNATTEEEADKAVLATNREVLKKYKDEDYLYRNFSVPSGLQTKKWVLFQIPKREKLKGFKFKVTFVDATTQIYRVEVKKGES